MFLTNFNVLLQKKINLLFNFNYFQVKVLSVTGQKVSLSMKDVDQESGRDLNPTIQTIRERSVPNFISVFNSVF